MAITVSWNLRLNLRQERQQVYCQVRKEWVAATPEELVRQRLITLMANQLGYPLESFALEKALSQIPHVTLLQQKPPLRRADIICFAKGIHPEHQIYPLLLVECKAVKLTPKGMNQLIGYNHYLQAHFVCVANQDQVRAGWYDPQAKDYHFIDYLPSYKDLITIFSSLSK